MNEERALAGSRTIKQARTPRGPPADYCSGSPSSSPELTRILRDGTTVEMACL
jgi:hypothetical protein